MKNIIVIGPPRIGKTTLSKIIVNQIPCFNAINIDVIRESIYKSLFVNTDKKERKRIVKDSFPMFIRTMIEQYIKYYNPDLFYIIEGDLLSIEDAITIKKEYNIDVVCIGTPTISEDDLFKRIRMNASKYGCWTEKYSDIELHKLCVEIIEQSKREEKISKENGIVYLDNSISNECLYDYVNNIKNN